MNVRAIFASALLFLAVPLAFAQEVDWTILVYLAADCDLEEDALEDLVELTEAASSDRIRVVVELDRAEEDDEEGYSGEDAAGLDAFDGAKRLLVRAGRVEELEDLGEVDTGDPATLASFVGWGLAKFPARRRALVLWDHGEGWTGFGGDDSHDGDSLELPEIAAALSRGLASARVDRLDLIGFDCCLMGNLETMAAVAPYARWFVGSEELAPGQGWDYLGALEALASLPGQRTEDFASTICDRYLAWFRDHDDPTLQREALTATLSVVDLDRIRPVTAALDDAAGALLARLARDGRAAWIPIARARRDAEEYGRSEDGDTYQHDLLDLVRALEDERALEPARALRAAIEDAVHHRVAGAYRPASSGISLWFPPWIDEGQEEVVETYPDSAASAKWASLVRAYLELQEADETPPDLGDASSSSGRIAPGQAAIVRAHVAADDLADAWFVLGTREDDQDVLLGMYPVAALGANLEGRFDGTWLSIGDDEGELVAPIESAEPVPGKPGRLVVGVPTVYIPEGGDEELSVTLYFEIGAGDRKGVFLHAFEFDEAGPSEIELEEGGRLLCVYRYVTEDGDWEDVPVDPEDALELGEDDLELVRQDLAPGEYRVGFVVEDLAGNVAESLFEVRLGD